MAKWLIKTGGLLIKCVLGTRCMSLITSIPPTQHVYTDYVIHILGACSHTSTCKEYYDHSQVHVCACVFQVWSVRDGVFVDKVHKQETISLANKVYRQGACSVHHNY